MDIDSKTIAVTNAGNALFSVLTGNVNIMGYYPSSHTMSGIIFTTGRIETIKIDGSNLLAAGTMATVSGQFGLRLFKFKDIDTAIEADIRMKEGNFLSISQQYKCLFVDSDTVSSTITLFFSVL